MPGLDPACRKFALTPKDKFQDKKMLIRSMQKHKLTINNILGSLCRLTWRRLYFTKKNKSCKKVWAPNRKPFNYLYQVCGDRKYIGRVCIRLTRFFFLTTRDKSQDLKELSNQRKKLDNKQYFNSKCTPN